MYNNLVHSEYAAQPEKRRELMRQKLAQTAIDMFRQRGIRAVKMDDLASTLSVSKRTLYELYEDKQELLLAGLRIIDAQHEAEVAARVEGCTNVIEMVDAIYRMNIEQAGRTNALFFTDLLRYPKVEQAMRADEAKRLADLSGFISRGIDEGLFRPDTDVPLLASTFEGVSKQIIERQLFRQYDITTLLNNTLLVLIRGICTVEGVEKLDALTAHGRLVS